MAKLLYERSFLVTAAVFFTLGVFLPHPQGTQHALMAVRWVAIACLAMFALSRRTLTPWIFVAMVAAGSGGAEGLTITLVVHRVSIPNENPMVWIIGRLARLV